jgi:hypothetical protein
LDRLALAAKGLIAPNAGLLAAQEIGQEMTIGDVGGGRRRRMDDLRFAVPPIWPETPPAASSCRSVQNPSRKMSAALSRLFDRITQAKLGSSARRQESPFCRGSVS